MVFCPFVDRRCSAALMISRNSDTPLVTAENDTKCALVEREMRWARVVLPQPGGPQRITEERRSASIAFRSGRPLPTISSWPVKSSKEWGRIRSASGALVRRSRLGSSNKSGAGSCSELIGILVVQNLIRPIRCRAIRSDDGLDPAPRRCYEADSTLKTEVNGVTIAYEDQGTGLPIVFLHAFPLNRTMWAPQEAVLSRRFRTISIDLRGLGESDAPSWRYSMEQYARDVRGVLACLGIEKALFV